jgi:hypothetical protein
LVPHLEDLEYKLRPGMVTLTWTSMNIDGYLNHVHQGLAKLEQLIININECMVLIKDCLGMDGVVSPQMSQDTIISVILILTKDIIFFVLFNY